MNRGQQLPDTGSSDPGERLLALYDDALPQIYGYLLKRCGDPSTAEDLSAETFLAAVTAVQRGGVPDLTVAWLVGVARHKLVDHWRRAARETRRLRAIEGERPVEQPWEVELDESAALATLRTLGEHHRSALTLRYLDGLAVPTVAEHLGRTIHATEALLVRARHAFRAAYPAQLAAENEGSETDA